MIEEERLKKNLLGVERDIKSVFESLRKEVIKNSEEYNLTMEHQNIQPLFINNYDFYSNMNVLLFMRKVGKFFRMNSLLNK